MEERTNDFTQGSILKKMLQFMLPVLGAQILQAMYGAVDILVVGWFGTTAGISGVSTGSNIVNLITFTVAGLSMGITVLIGRYIGEKREEKVGKVIGGAICFFIVASVVIAAAMLVFAKSFARLMQAPEEALDLTVTYVRICGGGIFFIIAYNVISSIFRGMGNSRLPLIFVAIACVTNIVGDLLSYIFTSDAAVVARSAEYLKGFSLEAIVTCILFSFIGYFNGHSQTMFVMLQGIAQTFLVRLPMSYIMSIQPGVSLTWIGFAAPSATIFGIVLNVAFYIWYTKKKQI